MSQDGVSMEKFDKFVERVYRGIPERTSTIEEKERAIKAKKKTINHPDCPKDSKDKIKHEISIIQGEIDTIKSEQRMQAMNSSVFPPRDNLG